jgi:neutral ceramidase
MPFTVGVRRRLITPPWGVELSGLGYYLQRTWQRIRDDLTATALVVSDEKGHSVAVVAADLMYNDRSFTRSIREQVAANTDISQDSVCLNFSHSHNAPTAGFVRGVGNRDEDYLRFAARQIATATIMAWHDRQPARLYVGKTELTGMTYNRTRDNGPVDTRVSVLRADAQDGQPLAVAVNFHAHPCVHMEIDFHAVSRDVPGEVVDQLEAAIPGVTALYLQGTCGDVSFRRECLSTDRRFEPARAVTGAALMALADSRPIETPGVTAVTRTVSIPTRRWIREEIMRER